MAPHPSVLLPSLMPVKVRCGECDKLWNKGHRSIISEGKLVLENALVCFVDEASEWMWSFLMSIFVLHENEKNYEIMFGLTQTNTRGSKEGVKKQCWCQHSSTAIWCRRLSLFSILLNWPLGLIIPLAGFRCHTVWDVGGVKGHWARAKTEGGRGSAPTQVCRLHACFALTSGSEPLQSRGFSSPGFNQLVFRARTGLLFCSRLRAGSHPVQPQSSTGGQWATSLVKQKAQTDMDANKTHLCAFHDG